MSKKFIPRPYQKFAIDLICEHPAVALMLDMGMGKTAAALTAVQDLLYDYFEVSKVLVIAPLRVAESTWTDECEQWDHLKGLVVSPIIGTLKQRTAALQKRADIYTINRENVVWLVELYGPKWPFDMVVIDESSSFKNPQAKRFKALRHIRPKIQRIVELTGTPAPNGLMDLWSQLWLLDRGERLEKTIGRYRKKYFTPGAGMGHVVYDWNLREGADKEIYHKIEDICVSMKSEDYIQLPPVLYNTVKVKLGDKVRAEYRQLEKDLILSTVSGDNIVASTAAVLSNKLLQLASGAAYAEDGKTVEIHRAKLDALQDIVEANEHKNIMVLYWFRHDLDRLKAVFPKAVHLQSGQDIKDWNAGKISMLLVHPASAGHGLNLQYGGNIVVWFSINWSLELYQQANKRLYRSGQQHTVVIHHLVAEGTIDEDVMAALAGKETGQNSMLAAIKARMLEYEEKGEAHGADKTSRTSS